MKALLLNGVYPPEQFSGYEQLVIKKAKNSGFDIENIVLCNNQLHHCIGCFGCWFATPGECVFSDYGKELVKKICRSDLLIIFSTISFGSYSSYCKKILDRCIPLVLPFIITIGSREYHKKRYSKLPNLFGVGVANENSIEEKEMFGELIKRNAANFVSGFSDSVIIDAKNTLSDAEKMLDKAFERMAAWK